MSLNVVRKSEAARAVPEDDAARCVVDLVHLSRMTLGDRDLEFELLDLFERQASGALLRLSGPASAHGTTGADVAHMLCGSARAVGAFGVAAAASRTETAMRAGTDARSSIAQLSREIAEARSTIASLRS